MLDFLIFSFVFRRGLGLGRGFAGELEALLDGAEEVAGDVVDVLEGGDDVGGRGDGLEQLDPLERICHLFHPFQTISVPEEDFNPLVVVLLGRVEEGVSVDFGP